MTRERGYKTSVGVSIECLHCYVIIVEGDDILLEIGDELILN